MRLSLATAIAAVLFTTTAVAGEHGRDIDRVNGGIRVAADDTRGDLSTVNGGIHVESGATVEDAETVNGGIHLDSRAHAHHLETVNGGIHLEDGVKIAAGVETVNGGIHLAQGVDVVGTVENVNGEIDVAAAHVGGMIRTVNGDVILGARAQVDGGILVDKPHGWGGNWFGKNTPPRVVIGPNAVVKGPLTFKREVELFVHETALIGSVDGATPTRYSGDAPPPKAR